MLRELSTKAHSLTGLKRLAVLLQFSALNIRALAGLLQGMPGSLATLDLADALLSSSRNRAVAKSFADSARGLSELERLIRPAGSDGRLVAVTDGGADSAGAVAPRVRLVGGLAAAAEERAG